MKKQALKIILKRVSFIIGLILGIAFLYLISSTKKELTDFENLALGKETSALYGQIDYKRIHCSNLSDLNYCLSGYRGTGEDRPVVLWLGNSQLSSINQYRSGEETATPQLHRRLQSEGKYLLTVSQPNANLQEHLILFAYLLNQLPIQTLVLPIVFDDMREDSVRASLVDALKEFGTTDRLQLTTIGKSLITNHSEQDVAGNDLGVLKNTLQQRSEKNLNAALVDKWELWADRSILRGNFLHSLYLFRNWALKINPSSTRKMIPGRYAKNRDAFSAILNLAADNRVKVLVYIVPLRNDVKAPYSTHEYKKFKSEMALITQKSDAKFVNLENLVPSKHWGTKNSTKLGSNQELDFMHFQARGHSLLAETLFSEIHKLRIKK